MQISLEIQVLLEGEANKKFYGSLLITKKRLIDLRNQNIGTKSL